MPREQLITTLMMAEGFDRKSAEYEADVILGAVEDDKLTSTGVEAVWRHLASWGGYAEA